jgi:phosphoribosylformylglycinamidine synthase subunit PurS
MKALVYVKLKSSVLDPQGQTIQRALVGLGHPEIEEVRQGKYFEIELSEKMSPDEARANLDRIAQDVLANPVIEEYRVEIVA